MQTLCGRYKLQYINPAQIDISYYSSLSLSSNLYGLVFIIHYSLERYKRRCPSLCITLFLIHSFKEAKLSSSYHYYFQCCPLVSCSNYHLGRNKTIICKAIITYYNNFNLASHSFFLDFLNLINNFLNTINIDSLHVCVIIQEIYKEYYFPIFTSIFNSLLDLNYNNQLVPINLFVFFPSTLDSLYNIKELKQSPDRL